MTWSSETRSCKLGSDNVTETIPEWDTTNDANALGVTLSLRNKTATRTSYVIRENVLYDNLSHCTSSQRCEQ
jgi:hypothetical protein